MTRSCGTAKFAPAKRGGIEDVQGKLHVLASRKLKERILWKMRNVRKGRVKSDLFVKESRAGIEAAFPCAENFQIFYNGYI